MNLIRLLPLFLLMTMPLTIWAVEDHDHREKKQATETEHGTESDPGKEADHEEGQEEVAVTLTPQAAALAGVQVEPLKPRSLTAEIRAPGEVRLNAYRTYQITPRIAAQVVKRHARLGDQVTWGEPLVTLSSVDMAEAQGELLVADREWRRVQTLGRKVVAESRYVEAQVGRQQAYAKVLAYGMTEAQATALLKRGDASRATGTFELPALQDGTIMKDDFTMGEIIEPGRVLFEISDQAVLWVEARVTDKEAQDVAVGAPARVRTSAAWLNGKVAQLHPRLDEATRTQGVRIEVLSNPGDLRSGQFVEARIASTDQAPVLAVPQSAVLRSPDGDWQVFVEEAPNRFVPKEVEVQRSLEDLAVIEGLPPDTRIATEGAFFLQSELAKAGFDIHGH